MRGIDGVFTGRRRTGAILLAGTLVLTAAACDSGSGSPGKGGGGGDKTPGAQVTITPAEGAKKVRPDAGVLVKAAGGKLDTVSVKAGTKEVPGDFNADRTEWRSKWTLSPATSYAVNATAKNPKGDPAQAASNFKTLTPKETVTTSLDWILEGNRGETYGVGMPIILTFDREIFNKAAVEKSLEVKAQKPVEGAWRWVGNQQVIYRTKTYWPARQKVTVTAHMAGVRAAKDVYGTKDFTRTFKIGASRIAKVDLKKHKMKVYVDGKKARTVPVSGGNGDTLEYTTTSGIHLTMEKDNPTRMVSPGRKKGDPGFYDELINYAVRISNSGEYLHQTSGDYGCLGEANCSHGCVRQPDGAAVWFYNNSQPGDVVIVTGTRRDLDWDNGWSYWELPWNSWKKGSALK